LGSPYTVYKNKTIAGVMESTGVKSVWDFGGNVSGLMKMEGSLRFQLAKKDIGYNALDLTPSYFSQNFAKSLGQPSKNIYQRLNGVVGDMRSLPISTESVSGIVCADVIEHIDHPELALAEMYRVLDTKGKAVIVVPSLYKLDAIKLPHILQKRFSSHENRLLISEWVEMVADAGFKVDRGNSRPLGIGSGLLYMAWLNPNYVPVKNSACAIEEFSDNAMLFRRAKSAVGKLDAEIDNTVLGNKHGLDQCRAKFEQGDIWGILRLVENWYNSVARVPDKDLHDLVTNFDVGSVSMEGMEQLRKTVNDSDQSIRDNAFFGNSALLVLSK
jgi:SAM-dependent methyltransferase